MNEREKLPYCHLHGRQQSFKVLAGCEEEGDGHNNKSIQSQSPVHFMEDEDWGLKEGDQGDKYKKE